MTLDDAEIGQQVICTRICPVTEMLPAHFDVTDNNRIVGHIGYICGVFPMTDSVYVSHIELEEEGAREFLTSFFLEEVEPFDSPQTPYINKLRESIEKNLVQITRD